MTWRTYRIAALLFGSGLCALVYQTVWLRELRLVFGASTPATAAVLAVFMGGLGYGSLLLSERADKVERPLAFYAQLELFIAAAAGVSKLLLLAVRHAYIALGGSVALGSAGGTIVRLLLTALVLLPATLAMGGTLPAAARAASPVGDEGRRSTALLYGVNTIGAVTGAALSTFVLLERLGSQGTLLLAVAANAAVALFARELDKNLAARDRRAQKESPAKPLVSVVSGPNTIETATTLPEADALEEATEATEATREEAETPESEDGAGKDAEDGAGELTPTIDKPTPLVSTLASHGATPEVAAAQAKAAIAARKALGEAAGGDGAGVDDGVDDDAPETADEPETIDHPLMATLASHGPPSDVSLPAPTEGTLPTGIEVVILEAPASPPKIDTPRVTYDGAEIKIETKPRTSRRQKRDSAPLSGTLASKDAPNDESATPLPIRPFVLAAAAVVGFAFLMMELVWYRVLSPLLGGSSYTFGLILAVALAGIGIGGLAYTMGNRTPKLSTFALTCVLEAFFIAIPYALGDRVAFLTLVLRDWGTVGLSGYMASWTVITSVVALPASIVAGYQFPLLIALLGTERDELGRDVGKAYAFNTLGAIVGSLLGGFFLLPSLSALGAWRLCAWLLVILAVTALWLDDQLDESEPTWRDRPWGQAAVAVATLLCLHATMGPTAVWRHSPIGAGRADDMIRGGTINSIRAAFRERRRAISWMVDGRESSIGLYTLNDVSFMVNGKSDGAAVNDGGTQVMGGLIGAMLQPQPVKRAMVIGLGSGSTAGWLGRLPGVDRVDVVELEPKMQQVAKVCAPVNQNVLENERVNLIIGDAREVLLTTPDHYDLVFSEPSNPYRAGVASLFTQEFYEAVKSRLGEDGVFVQWLQAYEIDAKSLRMVYATLSSVFPSVETWRTKYSDLVLVSRRSSRPVDLALLAERIEQTPYREALRNVWRVDDVEGVLSHFVARPALAREIARQEGSAGVNTDDLNALEFSIARALGKPQDFSVDDMLRTTYTRGEWLPEMTGAVDALDHDAIYDALMAQHLAEATRPYEPPHLPSTKARRNRFRALAAWNENDHAGALKAWRKQGKKPRSLTEVMVVADALAVAGETEELGPLLARLEVVMPVEANAIRAKLLWAERDIAGAWIPMREALLGYRVDPWPNNHLMSSLLAYIPDIAKSHPELHADILDVLSEELSMFALHYYRVDLRLEVALLAGSAEACMAALAEVGPHFPWTETFLRQRRDCYALAKDPRLREANADFNRLMRDQGQRFGNDLVPAATGSGTGDGATGDGATGGSGSAATTAAASGSPSGSATAP